MRLRAARYIRVSGVGQQNNTSLEEQLKEIDKHCLARDYETSEEHLYMDIMTGIEVAWRDRFDLQRMLANAKLNAFDVVVIHHTDRLARGEPLLIIMEELAYYGVTLESTQQNIEDTDEGQIILHFLSLSSKQEWRRIVKRTSDGRHAAVAKQHILGSTPSYGYTWNKDHTGYILNESVIHIDAEGNEWTEVQVVIFLFEEVKAGTTLAAIAKKLETIGIKTKKGLTRWNPATLSNILRNPIYAGQFTAFRNEYRYNGTRVNREGKTVASYKRVPRPLSQQFQYEQGIVPAIIERETFDFVQTQLSYNQKTSRRNNRNYENALCRAGIALCGHCKTRMHVTTEGHRVLQYVCQQGAHKTGRCPGYNTITVAKADADVWADVCYMIRNPRKLEDHINGLRVPDPSEQHEIPIAIRRKKAEDEIESLVELGKTATSDVGRKKVAALLKEAEAALQRIELEEKILSGQHDVWQEVQDEIAKFHSWCQVWREKLDRATYKDKRMCLEYLGVKVYIYRYGSRPRLTVSYGPPKILEKLRVVLQQS